jgi:hypothetical protein
MKNDTIISEVSKRYKNAYRIHYTEGDLREALGLYKGVIAAFPDTNEAGYSQTQIQNIVKSVVPKQDFVDASLELAFVHIK